MDKFKWRIESRESTEFLNCTLHTVHNAFRKGVASHVCGEAVEQFALDLHVWFKVRIFCTSVLTLPYPFPYKLACGCLLNTDNDFEILEVVCYSSCYIFQNIWRSLMAFRNVFIDAMIILNFWFNHFWRFYFKVAACKIEDSVNLAESITKVNEALFVQHVNSRCLTLSPALEQILKRW